MRMITRELIAPIRSATSGSHFRFKIWTVDWLEHWIHRYHGRCGLNSMMTHNTLSNMTHNDSVIYDSYLADILICKWHLIGCCYPINLIIWVWNILKSRISNFWFSSVSWTLTSWNIFKQIERIWFSFYFCFYCY